MSPRKNFDAIADVVDEARANRASLLGENEAVSELLNLLALPTATRRATALRCAVLVVRLAGQPSAGGSEIGATCGGIHKYGIWPQVVA